VEGSRREGEEQDKKENTLEKGKEMLVHGGEGGYIRKIHKEIATRRR
jgi:preprotein translocase subunit YajC